MSNTGSSGHRLRFKPGERIKRIEERKLKESFDRYFRQNYYRPVCFKSVFRSSLFTLITATVSYLIFTDQFSNRERTLFHAAMLFLANLIIFLLIFLVHYFDEKQIYRQKYFDQYYNNQNSQTS